MDSGDGKGSEKNAFTHVEIVEVTGCGGSSAHSGEDFTTSGSNQQHSRICVEVDDESGSSRHSGLVINDGVGSNEGSDTHPGNIEGTRSSNSFDSTPEFCHCWGAGNQVILQSNVVGESESSKQLERNQDTNNRTEGDLLLPAKKLSSSFSSSSHFVEDPVQMEAKLSNPESGNASYAFGYNSSKSEGNENATSDLVSTSQVSDVSYESTSVKSPPVQVMDRSQGYDPSRIPASIFERHDSSTPMDWSVASNDSLFSINVDNNSFNRDPSFNYKSGELFKSSEFFPFSPSMVGYTPSVFSPSAEAEKKSDDSQRSKADQGFSVGSDIKTSVNNQNEGKTIHSTEFCTSSNVSTNSSSMNSAHSFAFPILTDATRNGSVKGKHEVQQQQQQQQQPASEVTPEAPTHKSWFSWCCCSLSCRRSCSGHCFRCCCC